MQRTVRTFIAAEISSDVRTKARRLISLLAQAPAKVRWVEPENLHLTLKFLGEVEMLEMPRLCEVVTAAIAELPPFDLEMQGAGAFPSLERPRTLWLGIGDGEEAMIELHDALDKSLAELGFRPEQRRFKPHLTLGRVRNSEQGVTELAELIREHHEFPGGITDVAEVVVFSSEMDRDGPTHEPLCHAPLAAR
jgi:2'-5' RNA ligase